SHPLACDRPSVHDGRLCGAAGEEGWPWRDGELALRRRRALPALGRGDSQAAQGLSADAVVIQFLNGLASASSLFLLAAGLSLIFGVSRIVNFAHGSLYMLGMYLAVWLSPKLGFWVSVPIAAASVGACGAFIEILVLRRLYKAPELLQ